jgi:hypothetical protein
MPRGSRLISAETGSTTPVPHARRCRGAITDKWKKL